MTRKLFWEDAYIREFEGSVVSVDGTKVVLDQTAFNPRGGGLVSDTGEIGGVTVVEATKVGEDEVVHQLGSLAPFKSGDRVKASLDWARRLRVMRMHTAAHILSAVVNGETGALITGNQISPDGSRVDFDLEVFDKSMATKYVDRVNEAVKRELEVSSYFLKRSEAELIPGLVKLAKAAPPSVETLRIVQIGDVDTQADGGVHVRNTREIGTVSCVRVENKGKSNRRLYFTVQ